MKLRTHFKLSKNAQKLISFGTKAEGSFNYVDIPDCIGIDKNISAKLYKEMIDSCMMEVEMPNDSSIYELKLTNQNILSWEDYWVDGQDGYIIDPQITHVNLQKNDLVHANFNTRRKSLTTLNLEGNLNMQMVSIVDAESLEVLNISNCPSLQIVNLGRNRSIKTLLARNCYMGEATMERLLRDFHPVYCSDSNSALGLFRKKYETVLDLRGNVINWGNRRIASKIRLLLCNNWLVLWDNPPPASIVPPQMYAFFTSNLEESLIKDYYG